jgi:hypothetical protein
VRAIEPLLPPCRSPRLPFAASALDHRRLAVCRNRLVARFDRKSDQFYSI